MLQFHGGKVFGVNKMTFIIKLVALVALIAVTNALPANRKNSQEPDSYIPFLVDDSGSAFALPTNLQLPKTDDQSKVPFFAPEISTDLRAPQFNPEPDYYTVPIPAQDLIAPADAAWNPENDPKLFYELPAVLVPQEVPTNAFPKKFNKDLHSKSKPFSSKPKQEIFLEAVSEQEYGQKQKELNRVFDKLAKKQNKKQTQQTVQV